MNNRSEKCWSFLFQSNWLKTSRNERKLMVKQFSAEEVIFLCQYLPNNKSITIMIHHCNFFINKYGRLLPSNVSWRRSPIGRCGRPWLAAGRRLAPMRATRRCPAPGRCGERRGEERQLESGWWGSTRYHQCDVTQHHQHQLHQTSHSPHTRNSRSKSSHCRRRDKSDLLAEHLENC